MGQEEMKHEASVLAMEHWSFLRDKVIEPMLQLTGIMFMEGFKHGFKHAYEETNSPLSDTIEQALRDGRNACEDLE